MDVDLRVLRYFVATVDAGSATRAAAALHITQPVLSRQLRQLEKHSGLSLFARHGRQLRLTPAGEEFLPKARALLREADALAGAVDAMAAGVLQHLHLAVPTTTLADVVAPFIATLQPTDPIPLVRSLDPRGAAAAIADGADLAIVHQAPASELASQPLAVLPVWAYVRTDDAWAGRAHVELSELTERPLVLLSDRFRPRTLLDRAADAAELTYAEIIECTNAHVALALAAAGRGVAVVSDDPRFDLVPLAIHTTDGPLLLRLYAAWNPQHHAAATLASLASRLTTFCQERYGPGVAPPPSEPRLAPSSSHKQEDRNLSPL